MGREAASKLANQDALATNDVGRSTALLIIHGAPCGDEHYQTRFSKARHVPNSKGARTR